VDPISPHYLTLIDLLLSFLTQVHTLKFNLKYANRHLTFVSNQAFNPRVRARIKVAL